MSKDNHEARYVGTNWDAVRVTETPRSDGISARKVMTRGTHKIELGEIIAEAIAKLRQGFEVRFTDGKGEDAIRLYPCVSKDRTHMECCTRTMNGLKESISDKTVEPTETVRRATATDEPDEDRHEGVTPDVMVTCEVCGHQQRVGRKR